MNNVEQHLQLLGSVMRDRVTGITGMIESLSFDAYGCVQAIVRPKANKDGEVPDGRWVDVKRLEPTGERIMAAPFIPEPGKEQGPADKPLRGG